MLENVMKINPGKSKAVSFMGAWMKDQPNYSLLDEIIPEANSSKHLGIILKFDLSWIDHVNCTMEIAWKTFYFTIRILKRGYCYRKS